MKAVLTGCVLAALLAFAAAAVLDRFQRPSSQAYATEGVRLSEGS